MWHWWASLLKKRKNMCIRKNKINLQDLVQIIKCSQKLKTCSGISSGGLALFPVTSSTTTNCMPCANALYPWINSKRKTILLHSMISSQHLIQSLHLSMAFAYLSCVLFFFFFIYIWVNSSCMISLHDGINNIFLSISPSLKCSFQKVFRKWPAKDFQDLHLHFQKAQRTKIDINKALFTTKTYFWEV